MTHWVFDSQGNSFSPLLKNVKKRLSVAFYGGYKLLRGDANIDNILVDTVGEGEGEMN